MTIPTTPQEASRAAFEAYWKTLASDDSEPENEVRAAYHGAVNAWLARDAECQALRDALRESNDMLQECAAVFQIAAVDQLVASNEKLLSEPQ